MAIPTFYHADLTYSCRVIELAPSEAQHARAARRLQVGQQVTIINGAGLKASGMLELIDRHKVVVHISSTQQCESNSAKIRIYSAVPKGDRQRMLVESLTQIGVQHIVPVRCEYSATSLTEKMLDKWRRYTIEAAKQSQNTWLPSISEEISLRDASAELDVVGRWFADSEGKSFSELLNFADSNNNDLVTSPQAVFVGPEGGFSAAELQMLLGTGCQAVKLGEHILRTETAALVAAAQLSALLT